MNPYEREDDLNHPLIPLASDLVVQRPTEWAAQVQCERLRQLGRTIAWRQRRMGGVFFTEREVEALTLERWALSPTASGPANVKHGVQTYIALRMGITQPRVSQLLRHADALMLWLAYADPNHYYGWVFERGKWRLQVPTKQQQESALKLVKRAVAALEDAA